MHSGRKKKLGHWSQVAPMEEVGNLGMTAMRRAMMAGPSQLVSRNNHWHNHRLLPSHSLIPSPVYIHRHRHCFKLTPVCKSPHPAWEHSRNRQCHPTPGCHFSKLPILLPLQMKWEAVVVALASC